MAELTKPYDLLGADLEAGNYEITATALSTGLEESEQSNAVYYTKGEDLAYELSADKKYYIVTGRNTTSTSVVIPSKYDAQDEYGELPVKEIAPSAFEGADIVSVTIPNSVKLIGERAFARCQNLSNVNIKGFDEHAIYFYNSMGWDRVFCHADSKSIEMTNGGNNIFRATIPHDAMIFYFTGHFDNAGIGRTETKYYIGIHGSCWTCGSKVGNTDDYSIERYEYVASEFEDYVTIGADAFGECDSITNISIPTSVGTLEDRAFYMCGSLSSVNLGGNSALDYISDFAFAACYSLTSISLPSNLRYLGEGAFFDNVALTKVGIPKGSRLESIGKNAFGRCKLTEFYIPSKVSDIGEQMFYNCSDLISVEIANPYGWYYYDGFGDQVFINLNGNDNYAMCTIFKDYNTDYALGKILKMPAPTISLSSNGVLSMTDPIGIATHFKIWAVKEGTTERIEAATVNVIT